MEQIELFKDIDDNQLNSFIKKTNARMISFKKDMTIMSNLKNTNDVGVVLKGETALLRIDYNGNRTIVSNYVKGDIFGGKFSDFLSEEHSIISISDCQILFIEYEELINSLSNNPWSKTLTNNIVNILIKENHKDNTRIEILTKRTTREKLLHYFHSLEQEYSKTSFTIPFSLTNLSEYLAVDRSAMQREIKNLKDEGFIDMKGKNVTIIYH